jgi:putative ABC transport system permease protein
MTRILAKLAFAGIRHRRLYTALTVIVVAAAAAALTIALGVSQVADRPFERTFEQTRGAHVTATGFTDVERGFGAADLAPFERLPGVVASTGVRPWTTSAFPLDGKTYGIRLISVPADAGSIEVSRPLVADGEWPGPGEVLLERSFARFLDLQPGDRLQVGEAPPVTVSGIGVVAVGEAYPQSQPGLAFTLEPTMAAIAPNRSTWATLIGLRIADPEAAPEFASSAQRQFSRQVVVEDWTSEREGAVFTQHTITIILEIFGVMLLLAGGAVLGTLVGGRVVAQEREVGVLKTAGLTPRQVTLVFLFEQLALAVVGCAVGLAVGRIATPLFSSRSASLLNASETPPFELRTALIVSAIVLGMVAICTLVPSLRAGRRTTAETLHGGIAARTGRSRLGRLADRLRLPVPVALGARASFARPGRSTLTVLSLALTVAAVVATLGMEASLNVVSDQATAPPISDDLPTPRWDPVDDDAGEASLLRPVVYSLDAVLLFVGLVNLIATVLLAVRERVRDMGVLKAVGVTPGQLGRSVLSSQGILGLIAALAGIPLGLGIFRLAVGLTGGSDEFAYPAWWWLVLVPPAIVAAVLVLTYPLARHAAGIRVAEALRYE